MQININKKSVNSCAKSWTRNSCMILVIPMLSSCMYPWERSYNYVGTYCTVASFEEKGREAALSENWREKPLDYYDMYFNRCRGISGSFTDARNAFYMGYESEASVPPTAYQQPDENSRSFILQESFEICKTESDSTGWDVENACYLTDRDDGPCTATRQSDERRATVSCPSAE